MKKIAVMLPIGYRGGSLRAAKNFAKALDYQAKQHGEDLQVVFSYARDAKYNVRVDFDDLVEAGIALRETDWVVHPISTLHSAAYLLGLNANSFEFPCYCVPSDGANDFYDCDLWLIVSDRLPAPLFPLRKSAFVIYDYIQRYVPEIFGDSDKAWSTQVSNLLYSVQHAAKVFVTTPSTLHDLTSYAGVSSFLIEVLEMEFQPLESTIIKTGQQLPENYVLWATNTTHHKNHINALQAIQIYLQELGGELDFVVSGTWTEYFNPKNKFPVNDPVMQAEQVQYLRKELKRNKTLASKIHFIGNVSDKIYAYYLKNARFLLHPALYDNGTYAVIEAAYLGVPSLSSRYPAMEFINKKFGLNMHFFDPRDAKDLANALLVMEKSAPYVPLPAQEELQNHDWQALSLALYKSVMDLLW